jgi:hypothetical protein
LDYDASFNQEKGRTMNPAETRAFSPLETENVVRWNKISALLSMDVVEPFYDLIGLRIADAAVFQAALRKLILAARREFPRTDPAVVFLRRESILQMTGVTLGEETKTHLERWGESVFEMSAQDHIELKHWTLALRYCGLRDPTAWAALGIPEPLSGEFLRRFLRSIDSEEFERRHQETYSRPLSDWDLHMYSLHHFNDGDPPPTSGPNSYLSPTSKIYRGYIFWGWALRNLSAEAQGSLRENALRIVAATKHLAFIKQLAPLLVLGVEV